MVKAWLPVAFLVLFAFTVLGLNVPSAFAGEPIVGLWQITVSNPDGSPFDSVLSGWTSDGLVVNQDIAPILTGATYYGHWIKISKNTYASTQPFFTFQDFNSNGEGSSSTEGFSDGDSGYFNYVITVSKNGNTLTGRENVKEVAGLNPFDSEAVVLFTRAGLTLSGTKVAVDKSLLPD
jgi:hypothetical protein